MYRLVSTHVAFLLFLSGLATARGQNDDRSAPFQRATPESVGLSPDKVEPCSTACASWSQTRRP